MEKIKKILSESFGDPVKYLNYLEEIGFLKPEEAFCLFGDDGPVSVLFAKKYPVNIGQERLTADYIFYAATDETHRRQGAMSALIRNTLSSLKTRGGDFAVVIPANEALFGFYSKFGFETAFFCESKEYISETADREISVLSENEAENFYGKYHDFYGKRENTLFKTEEIFCQSVKENLFDPENFSVLTDGENIAFASLGEKIILREFTGKNVKPFASSVSAKYGRPVTVRLPSDKKEEPVGMILSYGGKTCFPPLFTDNMLN